MEDNQKVLIETYDLVAAAADKSRQIEPAAEWLLDNFYLIEEEIREIRRLLPPAYSRELPRIADQETGSAPRIYKIALELITHVDGRIDSTSLDSFVASYQSIQPLLLGELWALPLMLRLALIENLRRVAIRIASARCDRDLASDWADRMIQVVEEKPADLILVLADMTRQSPPLSGAFLSELSRYFHEQNPNFAFANSWLDHRLADEMLTVEQVVRTEGQSQAVDQVSFGNSIHSLRFLDANDWREFIREHSQVERTLEGDPSGTYREMEFLTRDRYRHAVEDIAKRSSLTENEVAALAVQLAEKQSSAESENRTSHVGYYLIDSGRVVLERESDVRFSFVASLEKLRRRFPLSFYLAMIVVITIATVWGYAELAHSEDANWQTLLILGLPLTLCVSAMGVELTNWLTKQFVSPVSLPRLALENGIPSEHRTLVAIPTMLTSQNEIEKLLDGLELRYLSNRDPCLHFALLTDLKDADADVLPEDEELINQARQGIELLNQKYIDDRTDIFYLLHRSRQWNANENCWMGYERKRGKLADLNAMLRGAEDRFSDVIGDTTVLQNVRFVITLDTDTELPREAAIKLIGTLAHPLNRPVYDEQLNRVVAGYTILQPQVGVGLLNTLKSRFTRIYAGDAGIDPYTRVVADVYQDLFEEGSFVGKGIYDVDSFERSCNDFPDNTILSHDLLEGAYCRSALVSDVTLYESYPAGYLSDMSRRHRWIRGDWQIAGWLFPTVRGRSDQSEKNPITALSRWKLLDNLRRSLIPIALLSTIMISWFMSVNVAIVTTLFLIGASLLPLLVDFTSRLLNLPVDLPYGIHLRFSIQRLSRPLLQQLLSFVFLPYEAFVSLDAIGRTLVRTCWTKRHLLEWKTASDSERGAKGSFLSFVRSMIVAPLLAGVLCIVFLTAEMEILFWVSPLLFCWAVSPAIAWWLSQPVQLSTPQLSADQLLFLRKLSRKTWRYFEEFVTAEENWLPPDNIHQNPDLVIASRTSPTNIGMALLSYLTAYDFGYCSASQFHSRSQETLKTLAKMERYRGHFLNWYDTRTLAPLYPQYVSMVDSGNLAANLHVFSSGCQEFASTSLLPARTFDGLSDTLHVLLDLVTQWKESPSRTRTIEIVRAQLNQVEHGPTSLLSANALLTELITATTDLKSVDVQDSEYHWWVTAFEDACREHQADLLHLATWLDIPRPPVNSVSTGADQDRKFLHRTYVILDELDASGTLSKVAELQSTLQPLFNQINTTASEVEKEWCRKLSSAISIASERAARRLNEFEAIALQAREFAEMDFNLLYDPVRDLFSIGFNVSERRLDAGYYDLLASEARLASYLVIAKGEYGQKHWFALGRLLTTTGRSPALLSWSGSMFEYLMPLLVMPSYENTLLNSSYHSIVRRQIEYGNQRGVPWGISESGYNTIDVNHIYQYKAFGVPGLGLKRGLAEDLVIAPYATVLALMVEPQAACRNLERLQAEEQMGPYGFYEAVDYTPSRLQPGAEKATVKQFMAHHEGMSLLSLAFLLLDKPMQRRFLSDPLLRSCSLLLQERVPQETAPVLPHASEARATRIATAEETGGMRVITNPSNVEIETHLLSNDHYHVAISSAGGGFSRWGDLAITRWREDVTRDNHGIFCYIRDFENDALWSNTFQPKNTTGSGYEAIFTQSRAEFRRIDYQIETYTQVSVSPEDDIELRRIALTNRSEEPRHLELTSYAEVVLAPQAQDEAHPAFSNLFVQTELVPNHQAIYCTRRPRSREEQPPWLLHMITVRGEITEPTSYETDRSTFIGRQRTLQNPIACEQKGPLSNSEGSVLDPIVSIRQTVLLQPNESIQLDVVTGIAPTRSEVELLSEKYSDPSLTDRVFNLAWTHGHILLQQLGASELDAQIYGKLASSIIYSSSIRRARRDILNRNRQGQSGLWGYGISGDLPIVLVQIRDADRLELVKQAVQAHAYWRMKGLAVDLVIWNEDDSVYRQSLQERITDLVATSTEALFTDRPGGIFIRRGEQISEEDRVLLQTVSRVILSGDSGTLQEQAEKYVRTSSSVPMLKISEQTSHPSVRFETPYHDLKFFNGYGGFSQDGHEYIIILKKGEAPPAPWVNVIANKDFGTVISEGGSAYSWRENSHEFRITPWYNDSVTDPSGEAMYLRDEETGRFWSPTPLPARGRNTYITRHGFGYTIFDSTEEGITTELSVYVATEEPVKFCKLKVTNNSGRARRLSIFSFSELVLGESRSKSSMHVTTEFDSESGAILARNVYSPEFGDRVAFFNCSEPNRTFTGDRTEFLGRNGSTADPAALKRSRLSGRVGAGYDPCAAFHTPLNLIEGQEKIVTFTMGAARGTADARNLAQRFRDVDSANRAIEGVWHYWSQTLGVIHLQTPDTSVNFLANGWLLYQTLACRMWARSGFYQSGGAYGFRDQLQDAMALVHAEPQLLREHLLRAAAHQFAEGDVQHWWHPPVGRGVRTHFSDDYLWLPLAICKYVNTTGDRGVLDEQVPFLTSRPLRDDEESNYDLPQTSDEMGTLIEHGIRAIKNGLKFGEHGLPLMGCGDWNDGMNLVGEHGRGESVWLGFFMVHVLTEYSGLLRSLGNEHVAHELKTEIDQLKLSLENHGWDGDWYRRAYFDDGTPLGSKQNDECQIDAISQSWSVLSGVANPERGTQAMQSVQDRLVRKEEGLILLLDPPFNHSDLNPGYIKGYVPGVRENGGQYTHSAIWTVMATAALGNNENAWDLFSLINPVKHGDSSDAIAIYRVEPYVVAADVYGVDPHTGRGGWTWYTGSAGWMYRLLIESFLGIELDIDKLRLQPCLPEAWTRFKIHYRFHETFYHISFDNEGANTSVQRLTLDGVEISESFIQLINDNQDHQVEVVMRPDDLHPS
ncbi:GH36-type glycosyl hydrolase domain-containing protein [Polystyrenella longa]|uniref:GH36-type glycosyl hydrolase domain-containing protein n=1 Tax=Polystyrenella longa TaxID=2528007 RepID=UPI001E553CE9|nr:glucoamylase family protein [Polystyrenella longa]